MAPRELGRRQGLQLPRVSALAARAPHSCCDPAAIRRAAAPPGKATCLRPRRLPATQRHRALYRLAQRESPRGNTIRETGNELSGHAQAGHDSTLLGTPSILGQNLVLLCYCRPGATAGQGFDDLFKQRLKYRASQRGQAFSPPGGESPASGRRFLAQAPPGHSFAARSGSCARA